MTPETLNNSESSALLALLLLKRAVTSSSPRSRLKPLLGLSIASGSSSGRMIVSVGAGSGLWLWKNLGGLDQKSVGFSSGVSRHLFPVPEDR